jgi:copper chaperone
MKKIKLKIKGMHCHSCEMLIKDALKDIGVKNSKINSKTGQAEIEFDEKKISLEMIKKTIEKGGYKI